MCDLSQDIKHKISRDMHSKSMEHWQEKRDGPQPFCEPETFSDFDKALPDADIQKVRWMWSEVKNRLRSSREVGTAFKHPHRPKEEVFERPFYSISPDGVTGGELIDEVPSPNLPVRGTLFVLCLCVINTAHDISDEDGSR
jgi:hypothetical protein